MFLTLLGSGLITALVCGILYKSTEEEVYLIFTIIGVIVQSIVTCVFCCYYLKDDIRNHTCWKEIRENENITKVINISNNNDNFDKV